MQFKLLFIGLFIGNTLAQQPIVTSLINIQDAYEALADNALSLTTSSVVSTYNSSLSTKFAAVTKAFTNAISAVNNGPSLSNAQASNTLTPLNKYSQAVTTMVNDLISKKSIFVTDKLGSTVLVQLKSELTSAQKLASAIQGKVSQAFGSVLGNSGNNVATALNKGITAFS